MVKTVCFGLMHLSIAFGIGYALTGDVAIAGAISLLEPLANTVAFYFFDRYWGHPLWRRLANKVRAYFGLDPLEPPTQPSSSANAPGRHWLGCVHCHLQAQRPRRPDGPMLAVRPRLRGTA